MTSFNREDLHQIETDQSIPQWKRELIIRRRALGRTLHVGNSSVKLTCPAVVALVRQPEVFDSITDNFEHVSTSSTSKESSQCLLNQINQLPADFPLSSESSSIGPVSVPDKNMHLLDSCSDVNSPLFNGIDVQNNLSEVDSGDVCDRPNYNVIMGEDKVSNQKKDSCRSKFECNGCNVNRYQNNVVNNAIDQVIFNNGTNGVSQKSDDYLSDSSEELQYGPGIVNKLKTKYMSMTLREQKRSMRPSINNLRRATSLENMLDSDGNMIKDIPTVPVKDINVKTDKKHVNNQPICLGKTSGIALNSHSKMKYLKGRSLDTMKRARSMDALLKSELGLPSSKSIGFYSKSHTEASFKHTKPITSIVNENIVIVENVQLALNDSTDSGPKIGLDRVPPKHSLSQCKRSSSVTDDGELPPPDVVKQTLKIFESSSRKRTKSQIQNNLSKPVTGFSNTTSSTNGQTPSTSASRSIDKRKLSSNKPSLSPKPILSPEKLKQSRSRVMSPKNYQDSTHSIKSSYRNQSTTTSQNLESPTLKHDKKAIAKNNSLSSHVVSNAANNSCLHNTNPFVPVKSCEKKSEATFKYTRFEEKLKLSSMADMDELEDLDNGECSKPVLESALENIRRGGMSFQFCFKNNSQDSFASKSHLPVPRTPPQAVNTSLIHQKHEKSPPVANVAPMRTSISPVIGTKQVGIIRPLVTTKSQTTLSTTPSLTEKEIEKNLINRVKSIEQPMSKVVVSIKSIPDSVVLGTAASELVTPKDLSKMPNECTNSKTKNQGLWDEKVWHQAQNTIVFNFSDRKEVPDYIENDGLILRGKRDRSLPGEEGVVVLGEAGEESCTDAEDLPPSPCDVTFEGDNVLINGKSNLRKSPKQVKLRIQFNDEATTMFEYPSESSLVEEEPTHSEATESCSAPTPTNVPAHTLAPSSGLPLSLANKQQFSLQMNPSDSFPPDLSPTNFMDCKIIESQALVEQLAPVLLGKARAPPPPTVNPPLVPKRCPMKRSLSAPSKPLPPNNNIVHDTKPAIVKKTISNHSTEKYFSLKNPASDSNQQDTVITTSPYNYVENVKVVIVNDCGQMKATSNDGCGQIKTKVNNNKSNNLHLSTSGCLPDTSVKLNEEQAVTSLPFFYLSPSLDSSSMSSAPKYCPVYQKPSSQGTNVTSNSSELRVGALLSPVLSKKLKDRPLSRGLTDSDKRLLFLEGLPLGTESLV